MGSSGSSIMIDPKTNPVGGAEHQLPRDRKLTLNLVTQRLRCDHSFDRPSTTSANQILLLCLLGLVCVSESKLSACGATVTDAERV